MLAVRTNNNVVYCCFFYRKTKHSSKIVCWGIRTIYKTDLSFIIFNIVIMSFKTAVIVTILTAIGYTAVLLAKKVKEQDPAVEE